jgi:hypothetical protein
MQRNIERSNTIKVITAAVKIRISWLELDPITKPDRNKDRNPNLYTMTIIKYAIQMRV